MNIYVTHSTGFDYKNELYSPIRSSDLNRKHSFILPHEKSDTPFSSKEMFGSKKFDLVLAEVSHPSTGQGIELGWADAFGVKIICMYKKGLKISGSLKVVSDTFIEYENAEEMIERINGFIRSV